MLILACLILTLKLPSSFTSAQREELKNIYILSVERQLVSEVI